MTEKEFRCSHELHNSIPTSCREEDLNLHNSIPATAVEKKVACVFQFQQKWRRKKKLENSKPVVVEEKDNLHYSIPAPAEKMTKLHDIIPATMERKIVCISLHYSSSGREEDKSS
jgi:hypothetical protein